VKGYYSKENRPLLILFGFGTKLPNIDIMHIFTGNVTKKISSIAKKLQNVVKSE
jgi:hypothetical protein